jgi:poly(hydroxyalkanoate) depolymerase family esterase
MMNTSRKGGILHRQRIVRRAVTAVGAAWMLAVTPAWAALTGPITGWAQGVPNYIAMYEYVPAKLAANPPILVVSHYCGGNAAGVFGEAQGGGLVAAADQYGFVMVFPQTSNNCWDVGSSASLTHDGGGDTQAIAEMVKYAITKHAADAGRVYATGTSSGAMMTEALLAVYPDVFKAGAEFSGVPAGCWAANYSVNGQWSGPCAGGMVSHTPQEWGATVDAMNPGYSGYRPRVQLWHGEADTTINYNNQTEAIKEWTDVLGLSMTPTSMASVTFNNHSWNHQSWKDSCGFTVLDAWSEVNGPHGTDANLNATYVIPFLGLDKTGPTDPEVAQCGDAGSSGSGSPGDGGASSGVGTDASGSGSSAATSGSGAGSGAGSTSGSGGGIGSGSGSTGGTVGGGSASGVGASETSTIDAGDVGPLGSTNSGCSCRVADASGPQWGNLALSGLVAWSMAWSRRRRAGLRLGSCANSEARSRSSSASNCDCGPSARRFRP